MHLQSFLLTPSPTERNRPEIGITGTIGKRGNTLSIRYALVGNLSELEIPAPGELPERKNHLWKDTCLEFFLGMKDSESYWEFNLSPAGHWNVYRFTSYRMDMREEPAFTSLPFHVRTEQEALRLSLDLEVGRIIPAGKTVEVAVGAILKTAAGKRSHWALAHPGRRPDFHRRDGFLLSIHGE